jgi:hypothetical protein
LAWVRRDGHRHDQALALSDAGQMHLASTLLNTHFERSRTRLLDLLYGLQSG